MTFKKLIKENIHYYSIAPISGFGGIIIVGSLRNHLIVLSKSQCFQLKLFWFFVAAKIWRKDNRHCIKRCQDAWAATRSSRRCQEHHYIYCCYCCCWVCVREIQTCYDQSQHFMVNRVMLTLFHIFLTTHCNLDIPMVLYLKFIYVHIRGIILWELSTHKYSSMNQVV